MPMEGTPSLNKLPSTLELEWGEQGDPSLPNLSLWIRTGWGSSVQMLALA